jgi:transposase-like protein
MEAEHTKPIYNDEDAARAHLETLLWPEGPQCPICGVLGEATLMKGKSHRKGVYNCKPCDKPFTVTVGTVFESSHIPLHKWVYGMHLMAASKKGVSALQLQRQLGLGSYRTAWFMGHRLREALRMSDPAPIGGEGKVVEADETYYLKVKNPDTVTAQGKPYQKKGRGPANKRPIVALVERGGEVRAFHVGNVDRATVTQLLVENVHHESRLHTDESRLYSGAEEHFVTHESVRHTAGEYARGDVHNNSAEGFFGVFKKGMTGVYQHCSEKHLSRYVDEFAFRHNTRVKLGFNDQDRAEIGIKGAANKRLTYRRTNSGARAEA